MKKSRMLVAALAATGLVLASPVMASAHSRTPAPPPTPEAVAAGLAAPFNIAFSGKTTYVADGGLNLVGKVSAGAITAVATDQPGAAGVAVSRDGRTLAFTTTVTEPGSFLNTASGLHLWGPGGTKVYADLFAYETAKNPDSAVHYGVTNPTPCVADALTAAGLPVDYSGGIDSHAYSVVQSGKKWVVADAGANALFTVDAKGTVRTLAVLPAQKAVITAEAAAAFGLPDCVVGVTYAFESVPTDVEVGRDGQLYVSVLPGGPESPVLGARGAVYRVNPHNGKAKLVAGGFLGATNLALGKHGEIYVSEFFAGKITVVAKGKKKTLVDLPGVVAVETNSKGEVWAATMGAGPEAPGTIVKVTSGHTHAQGVRAAKR